MEKQVDTNKAKKREESFDERVDRLVNGAFEMADFSEQYKIENLADLVPVLGDICRESKRNNKEGSDSGKLEEK